MSEPVCLYEKRGPAAWITLNRPEKLNALNGDVLKLLHEYFDAAVADDEVKVVVVAGAGDRAFSAGYDLGAEATGSYGRAHEWHHVLGVDIDATMKLWSLPKPTIGAVRGYCLAGGCELAMACDIIISTESGRFGEPEIRYGSGPVTLVDAVHPRPEEDQRAAVHRRYDRRRDCRAGGDDQPRGGRRGARVDG